MSSIMQKLKSVPTSYWVVGLGAAALGVDYLVEGKSSIVSSIWRGVAGDHKGGEAGEAGGKRLPTAPRAPTTPQVVTRPTMLPSAAVPGLEYMVVPFAHHPRRYYPAHEPLSAWARYARGREHEARWPRGRDPLAGHPFARRSHDGALAIHPGYRTSPSEPYYPGHAQHHGFHTGQFDWME